MLKKMLIAAIVLTIATFSFTACIGNNENDDDNDNKSGSTKNNNGINQIIDDKNDIEGMPEDFPSVVPICDSAKIIDADTYGENGFTVVYSVKESYEEVVYFYMTNIDGLDEAGIDDDVAYFEDFDIEDVHINGLTIEDAGDSTQVFLTLVNNGSSDNRNDTDDEDDEDEEDDEYDDDLIYYDNAYEVELDDNYPEDVVPIYPQAKVIWCSLAPSGSGVVELVLPTNSFDDAVSYYENELGLTPQGYETAIMKAKDFKDTIDGYKISVQIGQLLQGKNDPLVTITVDKK